MKKSFLWLASLSVLSLGLLASCNKNEPEVTSVKSCLLSQTTATYMHHDSVTRETTEYLYDGDTTLTRSNWYQTKAWDNTTINWYSIPEYRADGKLAKVTVFNSKETTFSTPSFICEYNEEGLLSKQIFEKAGMANLEFIYGNSKKVTRVYYTREDELLGYNMLTWDTLGNVVKEKIFVKNSSTGNTSHTTTYEYAYDNKKNPLKSYYFEFVDEPMARITSNNIIWKKTTYHSTGTSFEETYQYTYNEQDYPVQQTSANNVYGRIKTDFTYTCK